MDFRINMSSFSTPYKDKVPESGDYANSSNSQQFAKRSVKGREQGTFTEEDHLSDLSEGELNDRKLQEEYGSDQDESFSEEDNSSDPDSDSSFAPAKNSLFKRKKTQSSKSSKIKSLTDTRGKMKKQKREESSLTEGSRYNPGPNVTQSHDTASRIRAGQFKTDNLIEVIARVSNISKSLHFSWEKISKSHFKNEIILPLITSKILPDKKKGLKDYSSSWNKRVKGIYEKFIKNEDWDAEFTAAEAISVKENLKLIRDVSKAQKKQPSSNLLSTLTETGKFDQKYVLTLKCLNQSFLARTGTQGVRMYVHLSLCLFEASKRTQNRKMF